MNVCKDNYIKQTESNIKTKVAHTFSFVGLRLYRNIKSYMHKIMNIKAALCRERYRTNEKGRRNKGGSKNRDRICSKCTVYLLENGLPYLSIIKGRLKKPSRKSNHLG